MGRKELVGAATGRRAALRGVLSAGAGRAGVHGRQRALPVRHAAPPSPTSPLFGQLKTLGIDPTPMTVMRARAPRTDAWVRRADDLSGVDGEWEEPGPAAAALLEMAREIYWPFLKANAAGRRRCHADGTPLPSAAVPLPGQVLRSAGEAPCGAGAGG